MPKYVCVVGWPKGEDGVLYALEARVEFSRDWRSGGSAGSNFGRLILRRPNSGGPTADTVGRVRRPTGISFASRSILDVESSTRASFRPLRAVPPLVVGNRGRGPFVIIARHRSRAITIVRGGRRAAAWPTHHRPRPSRRPRREADSSFFFLIRRA